MKKIVGAIALAAVIFTTTVPAHASDVPAEFSGHGARMGQGVPEDYGLASSFPASGVPGLDVSGYQPNVDWWGERDKGARFSYNKVSEGNYYTNPYKTNQAQGARNAGLYQGGYHFAIPSISSGTTQAQYFINNGGGWKNDGKTLPGMLDLEWNPYPSLGNMCYNMNQTQMRTWINEFISTYKQKTGTAPTIYTAKSWWDTCVGNTNMFSGINLHVARYSNTVGELPQGWNRHTIWQYSDSGIFAGDSNIFNGNEQQLKNFALTGDGTREYSEYRLVGAIKAYYEAHSNLLGQPITNEIPTTDGGVFQRFSQPYTMYWHPNTDAHSIYEKGAIGARYNSLGAASGPWGYPLEDEKNYQSGAQQIFIKPNHTQTNTYWSPWTGAYTTNGRGAIQASWQDAGGASTIGFPTEDEQPYEKGAKQVFSTQNGNQTIFYWSESQGTHKLNAKGGLHWKWVSTGGAQKWGFPISSEKFEGNGTFSFYTQKGSGKTAFYWTEQGGTVILNAKGAIYNTWQSLGGTKFGSPITSESVAPNGVISVSFSNGKTINWTEARGTWVG